jgi:hypothetical protein
MVSIEIKDITDMPDVASVKTSIGITDDKTIIGTAGDHADNMDSTDITHITDITESQSTQNIHVFKTFPNKEQVMGEQASDGAQTAFS